MVYYQGYQVVLKKNYRIPGQAYEFFSTTFLSLITRESAPRFRAAAFIVEEINVVPHFFI